MAAKIWGGFAMSTYSSNRGFWRGLTLGVAFFGLTLFLNLLTLRPGVRGESIAVSKAEPAAGKPLPKMYFGSKACASAGCHEKGQVTDPPLLCRGDELDRFKAHDRHADAYNAMTGKLGRDILKRLNMGEPQTATDCLACHSVNIEKGATKHESFQLEEGVGCVVCHGAHERWVGSHSLVISRSAFRILPRETKESDYGMTDLWDPAKRTALCASCHVGNQEQGKFVTHDMYAAGHPPLQGFEVASWSNQMPRHWQLLREKPKVVQKIQGHNSSVWEESQLMLVGSAITLRESMRLLASHAKTASINGEMLDWALFDCYACHHPLGPRSWRQNQTHPGKPGRVPLKTWPMVLPGMGEKLLGSKEEVDQLTRELENATYSRPFGDPKKMQLASEKIAHWADAIAKSFASQPLDQKTGPKLGSELLKIWQAPPRDFDSARQTVWALLTYHSDEAALGRNINKEWLKFLEGYESGLDLKLKTGRGVRPARGEGANPKQDDSPPDQFHPDGFMGKLKFYLQEGK